MPFKSHLAVLVLLLCELHLIGSVNNDRIALDIQTNNTVSKNTQPDNKNQTAPDSQLTSTIHPTGNDKDTAVSITNPTSNNKDKTASTIHPTGNDKDTAVSTTNPTGNDKDTAVSTIHPTGNDKDTKVSTIHPTGNDKDKTVSTNRPNTDNPRSATELPKTSKLKSNTTRHSGGSATVPSMFTIVSLMCILLL